MVEAARQLFPLVMALLAGLAAAAAALTAGLGFAVAAMAYTFAGIGVFGAAATIASQRLPSRRARRPSRTSPRHG
jgi:hypothetical protein